jgi:DNA-binding response OmpR family regulator
LNCKEEFKNVLKDCIKQLDSNKSNIIKLKNDFIYDLYNKTLIKKDEIVSLSNKEALFLDLLLRNPNRALNYEEIQNEVWDENMSQDALRSVVKELRKKVYKELIKNVSGVGYRADFI